MPRHPDHRAECAGELTHCCQHNDAAYAESTEGRNERKRGIERCVGNDIANGGSSSGTARGIA